MKRSKILNTVCSDILDTAGRKMERRRRTQANCKASCVSRKGKNYMVDVYGGQDGP